jgi:hypothetical protein
MCGGLLSADLQFIFVNAGGFHQMPLQTGLQRRITVNGNRNPHIFFRFGINMMTAIDPLQFPAFSFDKLREPLSADRFQTAISIILSFSVIAIF